MNIIKKSIKTFNMYQNETQLHKVLYEVRFNVVTSGKKEIEAIAEVLNKYVDGDEDFSIAKSDFFMLCFKKSDYELYDLENKVTLPLETVELVSTAIYVDFFDDEYHCAVDKDGNKYQVTIKQGSLVFSDIYIEKSLARLFPNGIFSKQKIKADYQTVPQMIDYCKASKQNGIQYDGAFYPPAYDKLREALSPCEYVTYGNKAHTDETPDRRAGVHSCLGYVTDEEKQSYYQSLSGNRIGGGKYAR